MNLFETTAFIVILALVLGFGGWPAFVGSILGMASGFLTAQYLFNKKKKLMQKP